MYGYGLRADTIVGYTYRADTYCPRCIVDTMTGGHSAEYGLVTETQLDTLALHAGIDRMDECTFDTDYFPKVVFAVQVEDAEYCAACHADLIDR